MRKQHALVALFFAALSVVMTWPLLPNLRSAVAFAGDPYINIWILDWDWYQTLHHPLALFDGNIFHPARLALAFSENLYGVALLLFPLRAAGVGAIAAYNVAILAGYAFSGFAMYLLGRHVSGSLWGGIAAGVFHAFLPFRLTQAMHVQHVWGGWLPLLLIALLRYVERPTWRRAAIFALVFLINGLTNIHWLLFGATAIAATIATLRPRLAPLAVCGAVAAALLLPFLVPYEEASQLYGLERHWDETKLYSALPHDWLVSSEHTRWYGALVDRHVDPEKWLFPGLLSLVIGAAGAIALRPDDARLRTAALWIVLGVVGSFGLHTIFHRFLFSYVPAFRAIRVPARWAAIAYVGVAMLVAVGTAALASRRRWLAPVIALLFVVELHAAPLRWYIAVPEAPPVYRWLASTPESTAVLELPIAEQESEYGYMLRATAHHRRIVNGVSGFAPPEFQRIASYAHARPLSAKLVPELQRIGVGYVIAHGDAINAPTRDWLRHELATSRLQFVRRFDGGVIGDWLFATGGAARPQPPELAAFLAGEPTRNESTFGALDGPLMNETFQPGRGFFSGYAFSPYGIREVTLLFANARVRVAAPLQPDANLTRRFPWYPATSRPRFVRALPERPRGVGELTDVQVEIVDGRGTVTRLPSRWFAWKHGRGTRD